MNKFEEIKAEVNRLLSVMEIDADKFYNKGQNAASVRLRKQYKEIKKYIDNVSKETLQKKVAK